MGLSRCVRRIFCRQKKEKPTPSTTLLNSSPNEKKPTPPITLPNLSLDGGNPTPLANLSATSPNEGETILSKTHPNSSSNEENSTPSKLLPNSCPNEEDSTQSTSSYLSIHSLSVEVPTPTPSNSSPEFTFQPASEEFIPCIQVTSISTTASRRLNPRSPSTDFLQVPQEPTLPSRKRTRNQRLGSDHVEIETSTPRWRPATQVEDERTDHFGDVVIEPEGEEEASGKDVSNEEPNTVTTASISPNIRSRTKINFNITDLDTIEALSSTEENGEEPRFLFMKDHTLLDSEVQNCHKIAKVVIVSDVHLPQSAVIVSLQSSEQLCDDTRSSGKEEISKRAEKDGKKAFSPLFEISSPEAGKRMRIVMNEEKYTSPSKTPQHSDQPPSNSLSRTEKDNNLDQNAESKSSISIDLSNLPAVTPTTQFEILTSQLNDILQRSSERRITDDQKRDIEEYLVMTAVEGISSHEVVTTNMFQDLFYSKPEQAKKEQILPIRKGCREHARARDSGVVLDLELDLDVKEEKEGVESAQSETESETMTEDSQEISLEKMVREVLSNDEYPPSAELLDSSYRHSPHFSPSRYALVQPLPQYQEIVSCEEKEESQTPLMKSLDEDIKRMILAWRYIAQEFAAKKKPLSADLINRTYSILISGHDHSSNESRFPDRLILNSETHARDSSSDSESRFQESMRDIATKIHTAENEGLLDPISLAAELCYRILVSDYSFTSAPSSGSGKIASSAKRTLATLLVNAILLRYLGFIIPFTQDFDDIISKTTIREEIVSDDDEIPPWAELSIFILQQSADVVEEIWDILTSSRFLDEDNSRTQHEDLVTSIVSDIFESAGLTQGG
ncbi:uncharacterized protein RAG0_15359 [Rhynchosporium agropyri]|uniref:Uncharacterized protein n=1 Tax=Rhynchosporium agropyri TaxID=914238 RepID=A0A1E1LMR7_9HELO|nr:uncharacterized protein RAG0_15359 [Rhynchosporium agropyri]